MDALSRQDWLTLQEVSLDLHSVRNLAALPARVVAGLQRLVPCEIATLQDDRGGARNIPWLQGRDLLWDPSPGAALGVRMMTEWAVPFWTLREPFFAVSSEKHPHTEYYRKTGDGQARRISEVISMERLRRTRFFNEISRPVGIRHQLTVYEALPAQGTLMLAICRSAVDFNDRDRTLLELLRPHVACAWRRGLSLEQQRSRAPGDPARTELEAIRAAAALQKAGLTARELEVLVWIGEGKTNPEIALILGVAPSTIKTHVQRVLVKLGCQTRTAAARVALESVRQHASP